MELFVLGPLINISRRIVGGIGIQCLLLGSIVVLSACSGGSLAPPPPPPANVTISGTVQYEFVPPEPDCNGLNFNGTLTRPIRQATVQIINNATGAVIDEMPSNDAGDYVFTVDANTMVFLRVRAELKRTGATPSWDVEVRDNTANTGSPLGSRALYVLDGSAFSSGSSNMTRNLTATARATAGFALQRRLRCSTRSTT